MSVMCVWVPSLSTSLGLMPVGVIHLTSSCRPLTGVDIGVVRWWAVQHVAALLHLQKEGLLGKCVLNILSPPKPS